MFDVKRGFCRGCAAKRDGLQSAVHEEVSQVAFGFEFGRKLMKTIWKLPRTQWLGTPPVAPAGLGKGIARGRCNYDVVVLPGLNGSRHLFPVFIVSQIVGCAMLKQMPLLLNYAQFPY